VGRDQEGDADVINLPVGDSPSSIRRAVAKQTLILLARLAREANADPVGARLAREADADPVARLAREANADPVGGLPAKQTLIPLERGLPAKLSTRSVR
jgi:hypothetical protein